MTKKRKFVDGSREVDNNHKFLFCLWLINHKSCFAGREASCKKYIYSEDMAPLGYILHTPGTLLHSYCQLITKKKIFLIQKGLKKSFTEFTFEFRLYCTKWKMKPLLWNKD